MVSIPDVQEDEYTLAMEFYLDQNGQFSLDKAILVVSYYEDKVVHFSAPSKEINRDDEASNSQGSSKDINI